MRFAAVKTIYEAALKNKNIYFLTGDLGHAREVEFKKNIPNQYLNVGIAEQNMLGIAAGLALSGMKVFVYSIVPFVTMRCFEQIKNDVCYPNLDVNIIGIGGGYIYGPYANTHCSIEDYGVMRVLPNMKILSPADPLDTELLTKQVLKIKGPTYIRIGRGKEPVPTEKYSVTFGKARLVKTGKDITVFTTGTILNEVVKVGEILEKKNISLEIIHMHTIKPLQEKIVLDRAKKRKAVFTVEEHNIIGGLGSAIAEILSESKNKNCIFKRFGTRDIYLKEVGDQQYLRNRHGISAEKLVQSMLQII